MHVLGGGGQVHFLEEGLIIGMLGEAAVFLLEDAGVVALHRVAAGVVLPVFLDGIDKKQAEHLDALRAEALLLVQVLLDGAVDHLALHSQRVHVAAGLARTEVFFAAWIAEFHELVVLGIPDVMPDDVVPVNLPLGHFFELVERCHGDRLPGHAVCRGDVQLHLGSHDTFATRYRRDEPHIRLVVPALHGGRRHLDLLHQLPLVGIHRIELEHHVVRLFRRRGIAQIAQGMHPLHSLLTLTVEPAFHALRLVHDEDGAGRPDQVDGLLVRCV